MKTRLSNPLRGMTRLCLLYCGVCFIFTVVIYLAVVLSGHGVMRDASGAVVKNAVVPLHTWLISSFGAGILTTILCLSGLPGFWMAARSFEDRKSLQRLFAVLFAMIAVGVMLLATWNQDRFALGTLSVAGVNLAIALLVNALRAQVRTLPGH